jgi:hypothetical protein
MRYLLSHGPECCFSHKIGLAKVRREEFTPEEYRKLHTFARGWITPPSACDGHASLRTTSIYGDVIGPDERAFAARMWTKSIQ